METITKAAAKDLDLFVPSRQMTLRDMAYAYSSSWKRMANVEFRAGANGPSVSLLAVNGKIISDGAVSQWPMFAMGDMPRITYTTDKALAKSSKFAFSAGPLLIYNNSATNINTELSRGGFSGLDHASKRERAAIGIRRDNTIVHYANTAMTIKELQQAMLNQGCVNAMNLDGGGSVGVMDPSGKVLIGYTSRQVCCALVFRRLVDEHPAVVPQPPQPQPKGGEKMIVCIDPGHGGPDPGAVSPSGIREKEITLTVAKRVAEYLRRADVQVVLTRDTDKELVLGNDDAAELRARAKVANDAKADFFLSIHCNAASTSDAEGFEVYHYPGSTKGAMLATKIADAYALASGLKRRKVASANFQVLRDTAMPAALIELGFLTNKADCALLREPAFLDKIALGIAFGILEMRA